jgi:hypothetical protein
MNIHEKAMLTFARTWQPYGGNDDQILPEFGVSAATFYRRVLKIIDHPRTHDLEETGLHALRAFCVEKLREHGRPISPQGSPRSARRI